MSFSDTYREEAADLLADLEVALLELETDPSNSDTIGRVFRNLHTIKGSGAMFGFEQVASFAHEVESCYDLVREGKLKVTPHLISLTLTASDHIKNLLLDAEGSAINAAGQGIVAAFVRFQNDQLEPGEKPEIFTAQPVTGSMDETPKGSTYRISFKPPATIFFRAINLAKVITELRSLGECSVYCHTELLPDLDDFQYDTCYLGWDFQLTTQSNEDAIREIFQFVDDDSAVNIVPLRAADSVSKPVTRKTGTGRAESTTLRVSAGRLDDLVNIVGEIVTMQARLTQVAALCGDPEVAFVAEELDRLTGKLRDNTMSIRMLPIEATFTGYRRLVRDLARQLGKEVTLLTKGGDTELDKNVIDQINDPLVHLIRNCVDHGIESPSQRELAGKPAAGQLTLSASHSGAHVIVEIKDDGAGLDKHAIRKKGIERGLIRPDQELSEDEIFALILMPGFSTAKTLSGVSGRGVGMDIVKKNIEAMHGTLEIQSRSGQGSRFTLKLPLTLAIIDGLLVQVAEQHFVLPLSNILECFELSEAQMREHGHHRFVVVRGELVPYIDIRDHFEIIGRRPPISQVMIAETREGKFGYLVDNVIGDHKTVIKSLGALYRNAECISGATILGNGTVALILDLNKLARAAIMEQAERLIGCPTA